MKANKPKIAFAGVLILLLSLFCSCKKGNFLIFSGSENEPIEKIVKDFDVKNGSNIEVKYKGILDIMLELQNIPQPVMLCGLPVVYGLRLAITRKKYLF